MTPTLRRLNDRERYWGMTWPGWAAAAGGGAILYAAVKLSPFAIKPTVTIVLLLLALGTTVVLGVSGQALSPGRHLAAIIRYRRAPKRWALSEWPDKRGLVLTRAPEPPTTTPRAPGEARGDANGSVASHERLDDIPNSDEGRVQSLPLKGSS